MYSYSKGKYRPTQNREVSPFGAQFSLNAQATGVVSDRPGQKQNSDFRLGRGQSGHHGHQSADYTISGSVPSRRHSHQAYSAEGGRHDRHSSASYSDHRGTSRHERQVHHPATAYATQLTDLAHPEPIAIHHRTSPRVDENPYSPSNLRQVQSAGPFQSRSHKVSSHIPGEKIVFAESPAYPGIPIVYRTPEERSANPDRLNLDRRRLTICPMLEGEDQLRLLNFQHNSIHKIEHLASLRRLIFLDLYDNQIEEISGLGALKALRVLMLGKNRIRKIENLNTLSKLDVLDLHGNQISKIENISHLEELRVLNLAGNEIVHVNNLTGMESLTELNLRRNKIMTMSEGDKLSSLQRLFLSFNNITCFDDISCISDSPSLAEVSLDGNPFSQDPFYRQTVLKNTHQLRQLDMKRITEEERRVSSLMVRKEEEKKKETSKIALLKEKRRLAINNASRQWEATKSMAMAKTTRLQPGPLYPLNREVDQRSTGQSTPELQDSRPGSGHSIADSDRSPSFDLIRDKSGGSSRASILSDSPQKSKAPTPDLLANISNDVCHLAELEGDTLHLYGPGSLESLDKSWGVQAAGSVTTVSFKFIGFDEISKHLHKIRIRFPNVSTVQLGECNLCSLQQLNALSVLRRLENLSIATEGNPITSFSLWKQYLLFRLSHLNIKKINDEQVKPTDSHRAEKLFNPIADLVTSELCSSRLLSLLGDSKRRVTQGLNEQEQKAKKQLLTDQNTKPENVGKAGLMYYPEQVLAETLHGQTSQGVFARSYIRDLTTDAIRLDEKLGTLDRLWPLIFIEMVQDAVLQMQDWDHYMSNVLAKLEKRK
ncbi:leucine-rich repeat-containing protein 49-like isoform X2 [Amphiura filiformis]|uniref:leucine-rich repeat-containing protein 49-like isoform X2 n=1 Tax=Amphiura filiformis TaxID=82378 RepID=UPI003B21D77F